MSQSIWSPSQCVGTIPIIRGPTTQPWKTVDNHPCLFNAFNCAVHHLASHLLFLLTLIQPETHFFILILQKKKPMKTTWCLNLYWLPSQMQKVWIGSHEILPMNIDKGLRILLVVGWSKHIDTEGRKHRVTAMSLRIKVTFSGKLMFLVPVTKNTVRY